uniref:Prominin 1a n=1 Tax=Nothobranchius furzeri TaxID=105023 RepID=A0A8C6KFR2_NOTFU
IAMWTCMALLLLSVISASGELQQEDTEPRRLPPPGKLDFGYVPAGVYETLAHYEPGPIGILFHLVHAFLHAVQPNAFPHDLMVKLAKDKFGAIQTEYQKASTFILAIYYEIGFLVCAAVGLMFIVLVPIVGLFFCMCRCCDNCGGEMHQRQRKNADCRRGLLGTLLFSTSLVITIGVLCAYAANQNLSSQVKNIRRLVNSNMRDLHTFANDTPTQLLQEVRHYMQNIIYPDLCFLSDIGPLLGGRIQQHLDKEVHPALDQVLNMAGAMRETKEALENVSVSLVVLQEGAGKLNFNLSQVRNRINRTLNDPGCHDEESDATTAQLCNNIRLSLSQLQISANFTRHFKISAKSKKLFISQGFSSLNDTPHVVIEQTRSVVNNVQNLMDGIGNNISSFSKGFPVQTCLSNFTIFISHAHAKIEDYYPEIDKMDFYRWIGCITLCCMVVLVLAFNYLGLLCGTLGYDKHASPTTRGCISNTGGTLLMAGVGFSLIFSWVLMGVVTVLFLAGGNMEKLICEPFQTKELFKVVDTPYLIQPEWRNFIPGYLYNDSHLELTAESLYRYQILRIHGLCCSHFTKDVVGQLDNVKIDLRGIILLEAEGKQNLRDFSEAGLSEINYADYLEEVNKGVTAVDVLSFAKELESQTDLMPRGALQASLKAHVGTLQQIHRQQIVPMEQAMTALNQSMRFLERTASDLPVSHPASESSVQTLFNHNFIKIISSFSETRKYTATIIGYFHQYIEWVKTSLALEVAPCKPFSNILDTAEIMTCGFLVDSMNTFWMGLGCSTLFLLPSIILAVKLAKYYRRMDTEDVYDDMETGNNGYHSECSQGIPNPMMTRYIL